MLLMNSIERHLVVTLGFGGLLINTLPLWIGELAAHPTMSDQFAGAAGSLALVLAAVGCGGLWRGYLERWALLALFVSLLLFALTAGVSPVMSTMACCGMGFSMGAVLADAFRLGTDGQPQRLIAAATALGLVAALVAYFIVALTQISIIWILVTLSVVLFVSRPRADHDAKRATTGATFDLAGLPYKFLPFFVMMGAYWAYLDVFATRPLGAGQVELWLLGSLISGAIGSALAARVTADTRQMVLKLSLFLAAMTGAATYVTTNPNMIGMGILTNGFFLFLFFPLYLTTVPDQAAKRMAAYLAGFALGGIVGAALIQLGGYTALAVVIAGSGLIGIMGVRQSQQDQ